MSKLIIDPEFKTLIPPLTPDEFANLKESLERYGCRDALVVWNNILVDGHNRYTICMEQSIPFRTVKLERIDTYEQAMLWIINHQLGRRNVNDYDRAELVLKKKGLLAARAKEKQDAGTNQHSSLSTNLSKGSAIDTRRQLAQEAGISEGTLAKVEKIQEQAAPEVIKAVHVGVIKIDVAAQIATLPKEEQVELASMGKVAMKEAAKKVRNATKLKATASQATPLADPLSIQEPVSPAPAEHERTDAVLQLENTALHERIKELTADLERALEKIAELESPVPVNEALAIAKAEVDRLTDVCSQLEIRNAKLMAENDALAHLKCDHNIPLEQGLSPDTNELAKEALQQAEADHTTQVLCDQPILEMVNEA